MSDLEQTRESLHLTTTLLAETREEAKKADSKAGMVLAVASVSSSIILGTDSASLEWPWQWSDGLRIGAAALQIVGILLLGRAIWPRLDRPEPNTADYFVAIAQSKGTANRIQEVEHLLESTHVNGQRALRQLIALSDIALQKYRCLRMGMICSACGLLLSVVWRLAFA